MYKHSSQFSPFNNKRKPKGNYVGFVTSKAHGLCKNEKRSANSLKKEQ
jgi:hypothetical protein